MEPCVYTSASTDQCENTDMNTFGEKLRGLRRARGMSLRTMAAELAAIGEPTSHTAIAKWESLEGEDRDRLPKRAGIAAIAKLFNVKPSWLLADIYASTVVSKTARESKLNDIELLTDEEFELLIKLKNQFLKTRRNEHSGYITPVEK